MWQYITSICKTILVQIQYYCSSRLLVFCPKIYLSLIIPSINFSVQGGRLSQRSIFCCHLRGSKISTARLPSLITLLFNSKESFSKLKNQKTIHKLIILTIRKKEKKEKGQSFSRLSSKTLKNVHKPIIHSIKPVEMPDSSCQAQFL